MNTDGRAGCPDKFYFIYHTLPKCNNLDYPFIKIDQHEKFAV
jgi:hypothetical protein